jgi:signal transduction histidine kinase
MIRDNSPLVHRLAALRWMIPLAVALVGAAYMLFQDALLEGRTLSAPHVIAGILFFGLVGPMFASLTLTWAGRAAVAEAEAQKETRRRALQLETASQVSQRITAILDVDELLNQITKLIRDSFGYYHVFLFWTDADCNEIVLRAGSGDAEPSLKASGLRFKIGEQGITGRVAATGQPILCNDVSQDPHYHPHELLPETRSELAIPLVFGERVVGVLDVQSDRCNAFRQDDVPVLKILADQVAIALENARLFGETRQQFRVMHVLHDISLDLTSTLDNEQVLAAILEQAAQLVNAKSSCLGSYDCATDMFHDVAAHNLPEEHASSMMRLLNRFVRQVVRTGQPMIVNDCNDRNGESRLLDLLPYEAVVSVPLRWHGQVFGALSVIDRADRRPFGEEDAQRLVLFADLASIALKNSELYAQVLRFSQGLEQQVAERTSELDCARKELAGKAAELQRLLAITVHVQEEERGRIARDLHDGSNQLITGTLYELQAARESLLGQRIPTALEKLETVKSLLRRIEAENRRIILGLRPPILDVHGLVPALKADAASFQEQHQISCSVQVSEASIHLAPEIEIAAYRIAQESLNNVAGHAQAQHVFIHVHLELSRLCLVVEDDGVGFDPETVHAAESREMGLIGMRERAQSIGGQLQVQSAPGHGTRITLQVPLAAEWEELESLQSTGYRTMDRASVVQ